MVQVARENREGTFFSSLAGEHTGGGLTHCSCAQASPLAISPRVVYIFPLFSPANPVLCDEKLLAKFTSGIKIPFISVTHPSRG